MELSSRIPVLMTILMNLVLLMSYLLPTPQQNGVVERKNRTLVEMARTMLDEYKTPQRFWIDAIDTACHIINRVYLYKFFKKTAYELLMTRNPM